MPKQEVSPEELLKEVHQVLPHCQYDWDNEGQLIIYSNYYKFRDDPELLFDPDYQPSTQS